MEKTPTVKRIPCRAEACCRFHSCPLPVSRGAPGFHDPFWWSHHHRCHRRCWEKHEELAQPHHLDAGGTSGSVTTSCPLCAEPSHPNRPAVLSRCTRASFLPLPITCAESIGLAPPSQADTATLAAYDPGLPIFPQLADLYTFSKAGGCY